MNRTKDRLLVPVDFSETSEHALDHALELARRLRATLDVLHVLNGNKRPVVSLDAADLGDQDDPYRTAGNRLTDLLLERDVAGINVESHLRGGYPSNEILQHVDETHPSMVVMGTHGRTGVRQAFLGSQCQEVLKQCGVPVTVVGSACL